MDSIAPIEKSGNEAQAGEEVAGELVVAGGDAAPILETTEAALDHVATLVSFLVVSNALFAVGFSGDDSLDPMFLEPGAKRIGVIPFICHQPSDAGDQAHACFG